MQANPFLSLAVVQLPSHARLLPSSWCPDKDLLAIVTRPRGKDRLSLYKMQGSKVWEVNFDVDGSTGDEEVVDIAWSPDCQTVAVAHKPPRVTLHSIQDGRQERAIPLASTSAAVGTAKAANPSGIWWFTQEKKESKSDIPDIFKRGFDITGSAHSILKGQPLLDPLLDDSQPLTATDLFAFKQKPTRGVGSTIPAVIASWPTLPTDLLAASIQSAKIGGQRPRPGEDLDEVDLTNMDSVLAVADDAGNLHCFLDGSYPLGIVAIGPDIASMSLAKDNDLFFAHPRFTEPTITALRPFVIRLPHLQRRALRDVARVSSSVRELVWYTMRVVKDMRSAWFGGEAQSGARELGPKWIRALETRMKDEFGQEEPYAMLDLTSLLATGCATDALADYLGSGEQMTERGMQKWEQSMIEALVMLRDYSEKRVAPACQRLHLLLEEAYGWSLLPQYQLCGINTAQVNACMDLAGRAVLLAGWLAATARRELVRFTEFMFWLRYETTRLNTSGEGHHHPPVPRHDILEVNDYLMSGLVVSPIDRWFMGPVPQFSPHDLGVPGDWVDMKSTALRARRVLKEPRLSAWQYNIKQKDLSHLDRNLDSLVQELAVRSHRIFLEAANATARSAVLLSSVIPSRLVDTTLLRAVESNSSALIRERTVLRSGQVS
ncbi:hypothetical protein DAEQUDRAFT_311 [Daedalea quercina L-15889]|uniref:Anaphase-promoting complex subunit 4 n=1 Tax=Daedalea quercina L-15889 TaxID=1314783 RepID=A0A165UAT2_9APHY|nr:hypothetical protein DAEQUDRAFT_311 [Daedalea quercina L-15889]